MTHARAWAIGFGAAVPSAFEDFLDLVGHALGLNATALGNTAYDGADRRIRGLLETSRVKFRADCPAAPSRPRPRPRRAQRTRRPTRPRRCRTGSDRKVQRTPHARRPGCESCAAQLLSWARAFGQLQRAGVECSGSYGAALTRCLPHEGITVTEVNQPQAASPWRSPATKILPGPAERRTPTDDDTRAHRPGHWRGHGPLRQRGRGDLPRLRGRRHRRPARLAGSGGRTAAYTRTRRRAGDGAAAADHPARAEPGRGHGWATWRSPRTPRPAARRRSCLLLHPLKGIVESDRRYSSAQ
ncbi:hypothetical protein EDD90_10738 [Streptomyces sp. Ag109_O5-1]|nr:hypothetical protein EDD90_10738 [Streptomyces sp. Ag109_O5-1]